jgi:FKBP-type peptidyl-prolyl cis-trans isomerase FkpA
MATSTAQRVGIITIAVVMVVGTLGFYFLLIMTNSQDAAMQKQQAELQKQVEAQQKTAAEERKKSVKPLDGYAATPFDAASVKTLVKEDLVVGSGKEVPAGATISANYFGWLPDGTIFDSTNINGTATPVEFPLGKVIKGWTDGIPGMKEGGVRKLVIPADQAYGATGSQGGGIAPNTPLTFIVQIKGVK